MQMGQLNISVLSFSFCIASFPLAHKQQSNKSDVVQVAILTSNEVLLIVAGWSNLCEKSHLELTYYDPVRNLASVWRDTCASQHCITSLASKQTKQLVILLGTSLHFSPTILIMPDLTNLATTLFQALMVSFYLGRLGRNLHRGFHMIGGMTLPCSRESHFQQLNMIPHTQPRYLLM